ncbi:Creatinase/aminopeptidase [Nemania sp. FL0916]|nr:Creatinase/aminopeptidase [Nemania sp. FL0916]
MKEITKTSRPLEPHIRDLPPSARRRCLLIPFIVLVLIVLGAFPADRPILTRLFPLPNLSSHHHNPSAAELETCAWATLEKHTSLLDVRPINRAEFLQRQRVLAQALDDAGVDAFIAEPSASSAYYANISAAFHLSERPFLMILDRNASFSYLVPRFETGRINVASQHMVFDNNDSKSNGDNDSDSSVDAGVGIAWREEEDPYAALTSHRPNLSRVMVDEHTRHMVASGLQAASIEVLAMSPEVRRLRAIKTEAEIAILRGINSYTRQLTRALQGCVRLGVSQEDIVAAGQGLFSRAGVGNGYWALALFGAAAANPHGGSAGRKLRDGEFVLLDIGSVLHGYSSDVTRTFLPRGGTVSDELMDLWDTVRRSQTAGFEKMFPNETCSAADAASRVPVEEKGFAEFYTHRLGHGLGLEGHEHPYLNGANHEKLSAGVVVTNEPGIYVTDEQAKQLGKSTGFGIRLEDPILVTEKGGVPLTGRRAESPWDL